MNMKGMLIGTLVGVLFSIVFFPSLQLLVWGYYAPDWYIAPVMLGSMIFGIVGSFIGANWGANA